VHYEPAQEYRPHFDWFSGSDARLAEKLAVRGNRLVSVFVYLQLPEAGGFAGMARVSLLVAARAATPPLEKPVPPLTLLERETPARLLRAAPLRRPRRFAREGHRRRSDACPNVADSIARDWAPGARPSLVIAPRRTAFPQLQESFQPHVRAVRHSPWQCGQARRLRLLGVRLAALGDTALV
jgi:hypothetical protein